MTSPLLFFYGRLCDMTLKELGNKKILILGFGREGVETFLFLKKKFPSQAIGIADKKELRHLSPEARALARRYKNTALHFGEKYLGAIGEYDMIVKTPGIPLSQVQAHIKKGQAITSQTEIFFANCRATIIGVTGTKGKSTTCALLYQVLKTAGKTARLVGNIGNPGLRLLSSLRKNDIVIYELSSFQLMNLSMSPRVAILLNVYPEHFDHHKNFAEYAAAKARITKYQTPQDILIFNRTDPVAANIAAKSKAKTIGFVPESSRVIPKTKQQWLAPVEPVLIAAHILRIPRAAVKKALLNFRPLEHRIERVGEWSGITFINDSAATNPGAAIAALNHFENKVATLIAGGSEKGTPFKEFAKAILRHRIASLILFPTTGETIWKEVQKAARETRRDGILIARSSEKNGEAKEDKLPHAFFVSSMKEAVRIAYQCARPRSICLLSPACASFTTFKDYKDRGEQFKKFANYYGTHKTPTR